MKPIFEKAKLDPKRLVYAEGETTKILHSVQSVLDEKLAKPILIGNEDKIKSRVKQMGLRLRLDTDVEIVDPETYLENNNINATGITELNTYIGSDLIKKGEADALICGTDGHFHDHFDHVVEKVGLRKDIKQAAAVNIVIVKEGAFFICDTGVTVNPTANQIAENTILAAETVKRFGITPRAALLSYSNGDDIVSESSKKMVKAMKLIQQQNPDLQIEAPVRADAALLTDIRRRVLPYSKLVEDANLLIMPNLDAAKIAYDMLKVLSNAVSVGPILVGLNNPVHILTPSSTVRRIVNASAIAVVDAQIKANESETLL